MAYTHSSVGSEKSLEYRLFFEKDGKRISPLHDIPLHLDTENHIFSYVNEIPKGTNAKIEISVGEDLTPLKQDVKNGKLRFVADVHEQNGYPWNYGALPQTFEDPTHLTVETNTYGDKDPLDICEISQDPLPRGAVVPVKILGITCLIDEGETDWKVIAISTNNPEASKYNNLDDVRTHRPGFLELVHNWFRDYKIPDGKPPNQFAFNGEFRDKEYARKIIEENHQLWKKKFVKE